MAIDTFVEHAEPNPAHDDSVLEAQPSVALDGWLQDHPAVAGDIKEAVRAHVHLEELQGRARAADETVQKAEQRAGTLTTKLDPAGHRVLRIRDRRGSGRPPRRAGRHPAELGRPGV